MVVMKLQVSFILLVLTFSNVNPYSGVHTYTFVIVHITINGKHMNDTLLSKEDIWINLLTQKRFTVHIDGCDIWNDLGPFLNFLVHPFSSKLRSNEAKG